MKEKFLFFFTILKFIINLSFCEQKIPDGLLYDYKLNFITISDLVNGNDKVIIYTFSFEEPMWKEDINSILQYIKNEAPFVCINTDKDFENYTQQFIEFFQKNKIKLLFDPKGYNLKFNFGELPKIVVLYKDKSYENLENITQLKLKKAKTYSGQNFFKTDFLITCGFKESFCPSCPNEKVNSKIVSGKEIISVYKNKIRGYTFNLGNFLQTYPKDEEIKTAIENVSLIDYDCIVFGTNELLNFDRVITCVKDYNKFIISQEWKFIEKYIEDTSTVSLKFPYFYKIYNTTDSYSCLYLVFCFPPTTGHRNRVIINKTNVEKLKEVVKKEKPKFGVILLSNMGFINDIDLVIQIPEIKLVISGNHNYSVPQLLYYQGVPFIFPMISSSFLTRICIYTNPDGKVEDIKVGLVPVK